MHLTYLIKIKIRLHVKITKYLFMDLFVDECVGLYIIYIICMCMYYLLWITITLHTISYTIRFVIFFS